MTDIPLRSTIRLLSDKLHELPEPSDEVRTIDYFRVSVQVGSLKGSKPVKVLWCACAESVDTNESLTPIMNDEDKSSKFKVKKMNSPYTNQSLQLTPAATSTSHTQRNQKVPTSRLGRQPTQTDPTSGGSNVNLGE